MLKVSRVFTRPDTSIPWHNQVLYTVGLLNIEESFRVQGKLIVKDTSLSANGLEYTVIRYWKDQDAFDEFKAIPDVQAFWAERDEYYASVGITVGSFITEVVSGP